MYRDFSFDFVGTVFFTPKGLRKRNFYKKGVGGGATLSNLQELNASWFYNWGPIPGYKSLDNYDAEVWKKFVPLFFGKNYGGVGAEMNQICTKTDYCGKGNYYLVGNEPDQTLQDAIPGSEDQVGDAVFMQGETMKRVKAQDPTAKFIILGTATPNRAFAYEYIQKWKVRWQGDPVLADLPAVIKGWHFHTYFCHPSNTSIEQFKIAVDLEMQTSFGKMVIDEEIWITEMGRLDGGDPFGIMNCLINKYELSGTANIVNRYAWFYLGCSPGIHLYCPFPSKNYNLYSRGIVTDLGKKYANLPVAVYTPVPSSTPVFTLTPTPNSCSCPAGVPPKSRGNANCDNFINILDFQLWVEEYRQRRTTQTSDFNCDKAINILDFQVWKNNRD